MLHENKTTALFYFCGIKAIECRIFVAKMVGKAG
jgi:hypothetical protein